MAQFVSYKTTNDALDTANLFFKKVVKIHGFPTMTISNKDVKFQGHLWRTPSKILVTNYPLIFPTIHK